MTSINTKVSAPAQFSTALGLLSDSSGAGTPRLAGGKTEELREKFTQFVGEAFFGQMLKAMRSTVGKPAYFHGGRAEEVFQGQLDQQLAEHLTTASAKRFAEPMFERQFPHVAKTSGSNDLNQLAQLRRI
ncbi:MAG: rod-binding protein [Planctomycetes bacterium]|nr:rod-binding protein [Planctomycetota bacterium]